MSRPRALLAAGCAAADPQMQNVMESVTELLSHLASKGVKLSVDAGKLTCHAQKGTLTSDIQAGIVAHKAALIALLEREARRKQPQTNEGASRNRLPLSFAQERLWFLHQLEPDSARYNVPGAVAIDGELEIDHVERALNAIIARHESLRTVFPSEDGRPYQRILDRVDFKLECVDLSHSTNREARDREARALCLADAATPFDLANGPLLRGKVIRLAEREHILTLNLHHIVSDGWSLGILISELGACMEAIRANRTPELAPLPIQYADYAVWQRRWLDEEGVLEQQLGYWREKLAGVPESLDLAADHPRPRVQSFAGANCAFVLDAQLTSRLKGIAEQHGGTLFMVLLAAFKVLLHRHTGRNDICVGTPIANRQYGETEGLIGMFVNTLALRSRVDGNDSFPTLLAKVKATCLEAYDNQDAPFEKVVDMLRLQRNMAVSPLVPVMLILQNATTVTADSRIRQYPLESGVSKFDLTLEFTEGSGELAGRIEYCTALYERATIERLAAHFTALCRAIVASPTTEIRALDYLDDAEKHRLLVDYNATQTEYPKNKCLPDLFVEQVAVAPEKIAVVCGEEQLTFRQLSERCRDLALYLQSQGVGPDGLVGICMERSPDMVVGLLGILQAGGAYVPLDPDYPEDRLAFMLRDSAASIVLTQETLRDRLAALIPANTRLVTLPEINERVADLKASNVQLQQVVEPHHLAYVIYTSGSTGRPKGVMVEHRSVVNYLSYCLNHYLTSGPNPCGSFIHLPLTFDASVTSLFAPLLAGKAVDVDRNDAIDTFKEGAFLARGYDFVKLTPAHLLVLRSNFSRLAAESVRKKNVFVVGGEALTHDHVDFLNVPGADFEIVNEYGPTEATVGCTTARFRVGGTSSAPGTITIGTPMANVQIYILDVYGNPQPVGIPGELHIAGEGLARGYLNRPELTAEKFVANPFVPGTRMYKTGDLARWLDDGNIEYLGRIDTQVKIRGFRIETGEIEAQLNQHPAIQESVVIAQGEGATKQLVAFYRAKDAASEIPSDELRAHLSKALPEYMVPPVFVSVAEIPLTPNRKVDRRALERMDVTAAARREYVAPRNATETALVAIWAEVLKRAPETIGVDDDFFELGGHSLLATQLVSKIRSRFDLDVPLRSLFEKSSVAQLAELLATAGRRKAPPIRPVDRSQFQLH